MSERVGRQWQIVSGISTMDFSVGFSPMVVHASGYDQKEVMVSILRLERLILKGGEPINNYIYIYSYLLVLTGHWPRGRVFANCPGDLGSIPGRVIPKTQKNGT